MIRQLLTDRDRALFPIGQKVRYKPGYGTYGYEDAIEEDGRVPGVVRGQTATRIQVELTLAKRGGSRVKCAVNPASLIQVTT